MKDCFNKAKSIQKIIQNKLAENNSETLIPLLKSMSQIVKNENEEELENLEMKMDKKTFFYKNKNIVLNFINFRHILNVSGEIHVHFNWKNWLTRRMFYQYGIVYMCTRLCYNISQNLLVFFLIFTLRVQEPSRNTNLSLYLAIFPLIIYLSSCIASFSTGTLFKKLGRKKTYVLGAMNLFISAIVMTVIIIKN